MLRSALAALSVSALAAVGPVPTMATTETWTVSRGTVTFSLSARHLADLGLTVAAVRGSRPAPGVAAGGLEEPLYSFDTVPGFALTARTREGRFAGLEPVSIPVRGGLVLRAAPPHAPGPSLPALLLDFWVEITGEEGACFARLRTADPTVPVPLEIHSTGVRIDAASAEIVVPLGDLVISEEWAERLGHPTRAGRWIGAFEMRLAGVPDRYLAVAPERGPREPGDVLDVKLGQLYGIESLGRLGDYPDGWSGLSAATTSCNNGTVDVPWVPPMDEAHPFIGLALFRRQDGILEMIGKNWIKHGFFALTDDQCDLGCVGGTGGWYLAIGCSDTYSASNNGSRQFLGPRREVDPHTGGWTACGSFFDGNPADCKRSYWGIEPNAVNHRLEVHDQDLGRPGATYLYEGCYYVADDDSTDNNIGWRECLTNWNGSSWRFSTIGFDLEPNPGPAVLTWGDQWDTKAAAPGDGRVTLATQVTDLGGGTWHYEYALYNRDSDRQIRSFSVPVGDAGISNLGFHDLDRDPASDWSASVAGGVATWSTDDWATNPGAPVIEFQSMFNFRFDADRPAGAGAATAGLFKPGPGTSVVLATRTPGAGLERPVPGSAPGLFLGSGGPNPFPGSTDLRFSAPAGRPVRCSVLDVAGRTVQVLFEGSAPPGVATITWDGRDAAGVRAASGVYFFRLESEPGATTIKRTLRR